MKRHHDDMSSREGAMLLAEMINDFWLSKGHRVNARIFSLGDGFPSSHHGEGESLERWGVTSDLVAGMPR